MKYKVGDVVQIRAGGLNTPAADPENLWEILQVAGIHCVVRNMYDQYRANQVNRNAHGQPADTSMLLPWKRKLPIQFR